MNKIFTHFEIPVGGIFGFVNDTDHPLEIDDLFYVWYNRNRNGLGDEIIYGTAEVVVCLGGSYYTGKRIK